MYAAAATGAPLAVAGPLAAATPHLTWLVLYLLVAIIASVQHGLAVVAAGPAPRRVRSHVHLTLNLAAMAGTLLLFPAAIVWQALWFLLVAPAGFAIGLRNLAYANRPAASRAEWEREHLTSLITSGVVFHTAFFVLSALRWPVLTGGGRWMAAAWLLPAVVGLPAVAVLRYRRRRPADPRAGV